MFDENFYAKFDLEQQAEEEAQREAEALVDEILEERANNDYQQSVLDREDDRAYEAERCYAPSVPY